MFGAELLSQKIDSIQYCIMTPTSQNNNPICPNHVFNFHRKHRTICQYHIVRNHMSFHDQYTIQNRFVWTFNKHDVISILHNSSPSEHTHISNIQKCWTFHRKIEISNAMTQSMSFQPKHNVNHVWCLNWINTQLNIQYCIIRSIKSLNQHNMQIFWCLFNKHRLNSILH